MWTPTICLYILPVVLVGVYIITSSIKVKEYTNIGRRKVSFKFGWLDAFMTFTPIINLFVVGIMIADLIMNQNKKKMCKEKEFDKQEKDEINKAKKKIEKDQDNIKIEDLKKEIEEEG